MDKIGLNFKWLENMKKETSLDNFTDLINSALEKTKNVSDEDRIRKFNVLFTKDKGTLYGFVHNKPPTVLGTYTDKNKDIVKRTLLTNYINS